MKFKYLKFWLRWYWLPYKEETVCDVSFRWLCFEAQFKSQPKKVERNSAADNESRTVKESK